MVNWEMWVENEQKEAEKKSGMVIKIVSNSMLTDVRNKFKEKDNQLYWN